MSTSMLKHFHLFTNPEVNKRRAARTDTHTRVCVYLCVYVASGRARP